MKMILLICLSLILPLLAKAQTWEKSPVDLAGEIQFLKSSPHQVLFYHQNLKVLENYPSKLDWSFYSTPAKHQGHCNSCVAFSSISTLETLINIQKGRPDPSLDLSEQNLWSCGQKTSDCKKGWTPSLAAYALSTKGVVTEACMPYRAFDASNIACSEACPDASSEVIKIQTYKNISGTFVLKLDEVIAALQFGPLVGKMMVYEDFKYYAGGIYQHQSGKMLGGHSVSIMGYDLNEGYFIAKNSWGEAWGEKGFFRIKIDDDSGLGAGSYQLSLFE